MKQPEYNEGPKALERFEQGMKALFKVPKSAVVSPKKKQVQPATLRKSKRSDKD